jgi:hypothetical protein
MKSSMKRTRATPFATIAFTSAEKRRIEMAAKICGWQPGEGAAFGNHLLLKMVDSILHCSPTKRPAAQGKLRLVKG